MSHSLPVPGLVSSYQALQREVEDSGSERGVVFSFISSIFSQFSREPAALSHCSNQEIFRRIAVLEREGNSKRDVDRFFGELIERPVSVDLVAGIIQRKGKEISAGEGRLIERIQRDLPDLNKALISYDLIRKETDQMDLGRFAPLHMQVGTEVFEAFGLSGSEFRFIVHSAQTNELPIDNIPVKKAERGCLCASVISDQSPHFYMEDRNFALVLSVDPGRIVATIREDGYTPELEVDRPQEFYRFYRRLRLLTGTVDRLYRELGVAPIPQFDRFSRFYRFKSLQEAGHLPDAETLAAGLGSLVENPAQYPGNVQNTYRYGTTANKLREIRLFLENRPDLCSEKRLQEICLCEQLLSEIKKDHSIYHDHIHSICGAGDLLAQTPFMESRPMADFDAFAYNEMNIDLSGPYGRGGVPLEVKAILINQRALIKFPRSFLNVLRDAKAKGIPVLLRQEDPVPNEPGKVRARILEEVQKANREGVLKCVETGYVDERTAGEALLLAFKLGKLNCAKALLEKCTIPESCHREALSTLFALRDSESLEMLIQHPQSGTRDVILEFSRGNPDYFPLFLIGFIVDREAESLLNEERFSESGAVSLPSLIHEADSLSQGAASVPLVVQRVGKKAPSIDPSKAMLIGKLAYAGMRSSKYHSLLLELLSSIPEPEFSRVRLFLTDYLDMSGNKRKFGLFGQLGRLESELNLAQSTVPSGFLTNKPGSAFSLLKEAVQAAVKMSLQTVSNTALGILKTCRRGGGHRVKQA